jgi:hypothetical protein
VILARDVKKNDTFLKRCSASGLKISMGFWLTGNYPENQIIQTAPPLRMFQLIKI